MKKEKRALKRDKEKAKKEKPLLKPYLITRTFGQKAADNMTRWAGSWTFILGFIAILILWIALNTTWLLFDKIWDPKPFILLNLALSCLAALQAPIILMSQNRASEKDRQRTEYDYAVNRKAEREIQLVKKQLNRIEDSMMMKRKK
tara:strand:- start:168 stop:605 length:438 start_codon:yes stop_codon:yes gene_type:complete